MEILTVNTVLIFDFNRTLFDPERRTLLPGATELLEAAKQQGYTLVLLSKAAPSRAELVKELGLTAYFAKVLIVEHKTPAMLAEVAQHYGADMATSYVIGDRARGELALGQNGGWQTIWLRAGRFADETPEGYTPTHTVGTLPEILPLILTP